MFNFLFLCWDNINCEPITESVIFGHLVAEKPQSKLIKYEINWAGKLWFMNAEVVGF